MTSASPILSSAFLGRARAIAAEYAELSGQLAKKGYDVKTAKKLGELAPTTSALNEWDKAHSVCSTSSLFMYYTKGGYSLFLSFENCLVTQIPTLNFDL